MLSRIVNLFGKLFFLGCLEKNKCRVLPSMSSTYPYQLEKVIPCEWLSGANHSFKREVLKEFRYDEKLKEYSEGDDLDMSYRIFNKYGSFYITPHARLIHKTSPEGRANDKELICRKEVYSLYLFYKIIPQSFKNKLTYLWSRIGKVIFSRHLIGAYFYCLAHLKEIKKGDLSFFNK